MISDQPTIYQKLCCIQVELLDCDIQKSGYNNYNRYNYYELKDLLPPILKLCQKYKCTIYFIFSDGEGVLNFTTNDGKEKLQTRMNMPPLEKVNKGTNVIQTEGAYQTYAKKYLLLNMFCISEHDVIDAGDYTGSENSEPKQDGKKSVSKKSKPIQENGKGTPLGWGKLVEYASNLNMDGEEIEANLNKIRFDMAKKGLLSKEENEALYNFLKYR